MALVVAVMVGEEEREERGEGGLRGKECGRRRKKGVAS
jgi:hypothetical protein